MTGLSKLQKLGAIVVGAAGGVAIYLTINRKQSTKVFNSWTTNTVIPIEAKWDFNWDQ